MIIHYPGNITTFRPTKQRLSPMTVCSKNSRLWISFTEIFCLPPVSGTIWSWPFWQVTLNSNLVLHRFWSPETPTLKPWSHSNDWDWLRPGTWPGPDPIWVSLLEMPSTDF